jgi:hypothetical protein
VRRGRIFLAVAVVAIWLSACGGRATPDDQAFHQDAVNASDGAEVTFDATVLSDPIQSGGHERFGVKAATGERVEVDHNTTLAAYVPVHTGDNIVIHGKLYVDPGPRLGVHCTHAATSSGCPDAGWIELANTYYE